ncbi:MAG TPA: response regulator [Candidatus Limnocylindrales bacterium]|nr:response regulator [Candidatus Limnocylindrales bacterium]
MTRDGTDEPRPTTEAATPRLSAIVHDLNNALAAIAAFGHLIRTDPALPDQLRGNADRLVAEADRARVIAGELIAAVRPGSAKRPVDAREAEPPPPRTTGDRAARVLVVDDEASIRELLGRVLIRSGRVPVVAATGPEALAIVGADPPDAVLSDHRMAGMSGTELYTAIVALAPHLATRFAFMSGDVLDGELRAVAESGSIPVLAKPFDIATIGAIVDQLLDGGGGPERRGS